MTDELIFSQGESEPVTPIEEGAHAPAINELVLPASDGSILHPVDLLDEPVLVPHRPPIDPPVVETAVAPEPHDSHEGQYWNVEHQQWMPKEVS